MNNSMSSGIFCPIEETKWPNKFFLHDTGKFFYLICGKTIPVTSRDYKMSALVKITENLVWTSRKHNAKTNPNSTSFHSSFKPEKRIRVDKANIWPQNFEKNVTLYCLTVLLTIERHNIVHKNLFRIIIMCPVLPWKCE